MRVDSSKEVKKNQTWDTNQSLLFYPNGKALLVHHAYLNTELSLKQQKEI